MTPLYCCYIILFTNFENLFKNSDCWMILMAIFAVFCSFHFLQNIYTQEKDNPLTDEQRQHCAQHLTGLKNILIKICKNLADRQIADQPDFNGLNVSLFL